MAVPTAVQTAAERPFVGLKAYTEDQADRFFGRDRECETLIGNLRGSRLTLLYAESGVGKSSLLRAGLVAQLRSQAQRNVDARRAPRLLPVLFSQYNEDPVRGVIDAVTEAVRPLVGDLPPVGPPSIAGVLERAATSVGATVLVLLDQFEEYFLYHSRRADTDRFADEIAACIRRRELNANFLISIREDSYARLGDLFRGRLDNVYANFLHLDHLGRAGGEAAIRGPVEWFNRTHDGDVGVENALVEAVLDGVRLEQSHGPTPRSRRDSGRAGDHIETTYLQLVMERVWEEESRDGSNCLRAATLEQLGGARAVIAGHLDRTMARFSDEDQRAAAAAFRFLVTRSGTKIALNVGDLSEVSQVPVSRLGPLMRRLADPDVHILRPVDLRTADDATYEIFHDALARPILEWRTRRLRDDEEAAREELALQVARERAGKERAQALEAEAQRMKEAAERREALERRRKRIAVTALLALVIGGAGFIGIREHGSKTRLERAQASNLIATRLGETTRPLFGPGQQAVAASEAYRLSPTFDARKRLQGALQDNAGMPLILAGHQREALTVAWGPRPAALIASGSGDSSVRLWQPDGRPASPQLLTASTAMVTGVTFTPNGRVVISARADGALDFWEVADGHRLLRRVPPTDDSGGDCAFTDPCHPLALSPDGHSLVAERVGDVIELWRLPAQDPRRARRLTTVHIGGRGIHSLAFDRTGGLLAVGSQDGVTVWRLAHGRLRLLRRPPGGAVETYGVSWSPSGELAAATDDGVLRWGVDGHKLPKLTTSVRENAVAFTHGGGQLTTGGEDLQVTAWDTRTLDAVGVPRPHTDTVNALAVSPDGDRVAAADDDFLVKVWPMRADRALAVHAPALHGAQDVAFLSRRVMATHDDSGGVRLWRLQGTPGVPRPPQPLAELSGYGPFAAGSSRLVGIDSDYSHLALWDARAACARPRTPACLQGQKLPISADVAALALDRSATTLAVGGDTGSVTLWNIRDPRAVRRLAQAQVGRASIDQLAIEPHAQLLLVRSGSTTRLWSYADVARTHRLSAVGGNLHAQGRYSVATAAFSPDGGVLAVGGEDQTVTLLGLSNPAHPRELATLEQSDTIFALAYTPDGRTLAAVDGDGSACLYDTTSGRGIGSTDCLVMPAAFSLGSADALKARFDATGSTLFTVGVLGDVTLWSSLLWTQDAGEATTRDLNAQACRLAGRNLTADEWATVFSGTDLAGHQHRTCAGFPVR